MDGSCDRKLSREDIMSGAQALGEIADPLATGNSQSRAERAAHYRHYADQFQVLADDERNKSRRAKLLRLALRYEELAARTQVKP